jgi:glycine dehydrogenase subunit 2
MSTMNTVGRPTTPNRVESKPATLTGGRGLLQNEHLIFEGDGWGKTGVDLPEPKTDGSDLGDLVRRDPIGLPGLSEPETMRHYVRLSQKNHAIDLAIYPLGSCTMKHNPRLNEKMARLPGFSDIHPLQPTSTVQGALEVMDTLSHWLKTLTGMPAVALSPKAGAHGELCGLMAIRAAHEASGQHEQRRKVLVPTSAHGTNPATAAFVGYTVVEVAQTDDGRVDVADLASKLGDDVAAIMVTNPNTCGLFERDILEISRLTHEAGAYFYCDGANFNAIVGRVRPGDLGVDAMHINLHKTFSTPHGGGGPGAGAVGVSARLEPFLPVPVVGREGDAYRWLTEADRPQSIGRLSAFMGNAGVLLRAYVYMRMLGREGMSRVGEFATLNANYLMARLRRAGFDLAYPTRRASHEFIVTMKRQAKELNVTAMDVAKRLLDYGFHAPTTYFPLLVPECLLIEPTETESRETLDAFVESMVAILGEAESDAAKLKGAPYTMPVRRLDDVRAAKQLELTWKPVNSAA